MDAPAHRLDESARDREAEAGAGLAPIGASALGTPTALSLDANSIDVFIRDEVNRTRTRWWTASGGWSQ